MRSPPLVGAPDGMNNETAYRGGGRRVVVMRYLMAVLTIPSRILPVLDAKDECVSALDAQLVTADRQFPALSLKECCFGGIPQSSIN